MKNIFKNKSFLIFILIVFISIGFAYLSSNLSIGGIANVKHVKWNIYFDNVKETKGTNLAVVHPSTTGNKTTSLNYEVALDDPGDSYSFDVDVVNDGNIDAMVNLITNSFDSLTEEQKKLFYFSITYKDGMEIESKNLLKASSYDTFTITVSYKRDIVIEDLPSEDINLNIDIDLEYRQAKDEDSKRNDKLKIRISDLSNNGNTGKAYNGVLLNDDGTVTTDGSTGFIKCGFSNYNFGNQVSMVMKVKFLEIDTSRREYSLFGNWEAGGGGFTLQYGYLTYGFYINGKYNVFVSDFIPNINTLYTLVGVYDGNGYQIYANGEKLNFNNTFVFNDSMSIKTQNVSGNIGISKASLNIATNENIDGSYWTHTKLNLHSVLLFKRALSEEEILSNYTSEVNPTNTDQMLLYYNFG